MSSLMQTILREGYHMDEYDFVTGIVDEMLSSALESYCQSYGINVECVDNHELGSTVRMYAQTSVQALAEIALSIRDTLIELKIPMIANIDVCAYQFVGLVNGVVHLRQIQITELASIMKFREDQDSWQMLSRLQKSIKSPTQY